MMDKYVNVRELAQGGQGVVYSATRACDGTPVALKLRKRTEDNTQGLLREICFSKLAQNIGGVTRLYEHTLTAEWLMLVFERDVHAMDMFEFIETRGVLEESAAKKVFADLVQIVVDLRNATILHRDIKDENILINPNTMAIKLIDFGVSMDYKDDKLYNRFGGTRYYAPPEWLNLGQYTAHGLNAWTLGCVLYTMLVGYAPFHTLEKKTCGVYSTEK
jgi:serine/threonine protein kinase